MLSGLTSTSDGLTDVLSRIAKVAADLARVIAANGIAHDLGSSVEDADHGDPQKALDVIADQMFVEALRGSPVRFYASEEQAEAVELNPSGTWAMAIDPLDGSSNIDVNVSIGTIFALRPAGDTAEDSFLQPGTCQRAAGYIIYGPQTVMVLTTGAGVTRWVLDPESADFVQLPGTMAVPASTTEFAINSSNYRHWPPPIRAFVDDLVAGAEGPRRNNFNMRWIASLVAETHRILTRGGVFLYPSDSRKGYERGRLRLLYECAPIAMLIEQAGGLATDGTSRILDQVPDDLHARTPLVFGSLEKVARVAAYHDLPDAETSALFGSRSLFRS
ncbi:MAG: class 1 fructose-bisphosphatase [Paracoccus sp. (in: a-proteobacteria)]|uniref:class 1 fructose-bisphosphatase n=1 Tax=Paracoccus sp. TaxID=267 RepID=UPI0026DF03BB|nr:class 1 fructose-bisphosphatase [Paracoccus sp. (in: a-proteobacteria)]MDO5622802.1 class 1 fructose-bisphosphatase [Paracoccus sp. (in: a-proteobacteria)]